ncbi:hypothetical protein SDC9_195166 [bioreactor metagenome]|uniref:Uncharacterized protein n=1 Tax=bioreactor metagenome TaxID=1076179 RepID=A0A645IJR2_9ZZZZ
MDNLEANYRSPAFSMPESNDSNQIGHPSHSNILQSGYDAGVRGSEEAVAESVATAHYQPLT